MRMALMLMASEGGGEHGTSFADYISHHLQHLASRVQTGLFDPSVVHLDTIFFSLLTAAIVLFVLRLAAGRATSGVPGRLQAAVEILVEAVNEQARTMVNGPLTYIAPLALTVFAWVVLMN